MAVREDADRGRAGDWTAVISAGERTTRTADDPVGDSVVADTERDRPVIDAVQRLAGARGVPEEVTALEKHARVRPAGGC